MLANREITHREKAKEFTMKKIDDESKKNWVPFCVRSGIEGEVRKANPGKYREVLPDGRIKYNDMQLLRDTEKE